VSEIAAWCVVCGGRYTEEQILGASACPGCASTGVPCDPKQDLDVRINWHELRILVMWAENWARQSATSGTDPGFDGRAVVAGIARRLQGQQPDMIPLTLFGEIQDLRKEFGEVTTNVKGPPPIPINGPGAVT
jgi:hypothetical protein